MAERAEVQVAQGAVAPRPRALLAADHAEEKQVHGVLARVLGATDEPPRLAVLNACESLEGADDLLRTVPTVIGVSKSITDLAAVTFAARFYAAIASAQSVATAVEQARTAMQMASLEDSHLPEIRTREDVDPTSLVLVTPVS